MAERLRSAISPVILADAYDRCRRHGLRSCSRPAASTRRVTIEELARAQGVKPMESTEEWAADIFESDEELDAFLAHLRVWRASGR